MSPDVFPSQVNFAEAFGLLLMLLGAFLFGWFLADHEVRCDLETAHAAELNGLRSTLLSQLRAREAELAGMKAKLAHRAKPKLAESR